MRPQSVLAPLLVPLVINFASGEATTENAMTQHWKDEAPCIYPTFRYRNAAQMIDWLCKAFGFHVHARHGEGDDVHHAELALGSSLIMLGQTRDDAYGNMVGASGQAGGKATYVAVTDPDALYERAKAADAEILQPPTDRDYGSREFLCRDPEGNVWSFGTYWPKVGEDA